MNTNYHFRLGWIDADAAIKLLNRSPGRLHLDKLFKVKGADYQKGFEKRLSEISKGAEA
jgi:hypothetical protein